MMKKVFMLSSQLMFSKGVENLLDEQPGMQIVGQENQAQRAVQKISRLQPDVVIVDHKDIASTPANIVGDIMHVAPTTKIILLNLENDQILVYSGERRTAHCVDDLVKAIDTDANETGSISVSEWSLLAAERAQVYGLYGDVCNHAVGNEMLDNLIDLSLGQRGVLQQGDDLTGDLQSGMDTLQQFQREVVRRPRPTILAELEAEYRRIIGNGSGKPRPAACESFYVSGDTACESAYTALIQAYAGVEGYGARSTPLHPDFIGAELGHMQRLCAAEFEAWVGGRSLEAVEIQAQECAFIKDHLIRWVPRCCDMVLGGSTHDFYRSMGHLIKGFILNEAFRVAELMEWSNVLGHFSDDQSGPE